jgi:ABC-type transport system involved in multi-copper enzyme maturation permease subunit
MAIARRDWYYVIRWIVGIVLLVCLLFFARYEWEMWSSQEMSRRSLAALNEQVFSISIFVQGLAMLTLTPALFGGAMAQEKSRRRLESLLTTTLSSAEIVLGKSAARLCLLMTILMVTAPISCLMGLNGGVDIGLVGISYCALLTTGLLSAAMATFISTLTDRPYRAITASYSLVLAWLLLPFLVDPSAIGPGPPTISSRIVEGIAFVGHWVGVTNPMFVLDEIGRSPSRDPVPPLALMMAAQVAISLFLIAGAAAILRPLAKRTGSSASRYKPVSFLLGRRSLLPRRACGDRPILWKECQVARTRVLTRLLIRLAFLGLAIPVGIATWSVTTAAFVELQNHGYGSQVLHPARDELNVVLRVAVVTLYIAMALFVATRSSLSFTEEVEKNTWISLIATPLDATEILSGKVLGTFWGLWWPGLIYLGAVILGVAAGAVHPVAGVLVLVELPIFLTFAAALGTAFSLSSKSSVVAIGKTISAFLFINVGLLMCCFPATDRGILFAMTPLIQGASLATYGEVERLLDEDSRSLTLTIILSLVTYGTVTLFLIGLCESRFNFAADRPNRDGAVEIISWKMVGKWLAPNLIGRDDSLK